MTYEEAQAWCDETYQHNPPHEEPVEIGFVLQNEDGSYEAYVGMEWQFDWFIVCHARSMKAVRFYEHEIEHGWIDLRLEPDELE